MNFPRDRRWYIVSGIAVLLPTVAFAQSPAVTIRATRLLDGRGGTVENAVVTVENGRITRVERATAGAPSTYDLKDMTLLPGLIDAHAHVGWYFNRQGRYHSGRGDGETAQDGVTASEANVHATLLNGVTTMQSPGAATDKDIRDRIAADKLPGPRVLTSLQPLQSANSTPEQFRATVRQRKEQGADFIKVFAAGSIRDGGAPTLSQAQLDAICNEAKTVGLRVMVHAHSAESVKRAVQAGCTQIEHGVFVTEDNLKMMAERGTYFDPQVNLVFRNYLENRSKYQGIGNYNDVGFASMQQALPLALNAFRKAIATSGVKVVFGTDAVAGSHGRNVDELVNRVRDGGQSPMDAIMSATSLGAEAIGMGKQLGALAPGFDADIIATDGDPSKDILALHRVAFVMKGGKVFRNPIGEKPPEPAALVGKWLGVAGPNVTVALEFAADGEAKVTPEPGNPPAVTRYATDGGRLTVTYPDGSHKAYRWRIDAQLLTLDQDGGPRFIFRKAS
jgi:imidazolonepropionase-like amidohydrolase